MNCRNASLHDEEGTRKKMRRKMAEFSRRLDVLLLQRQSYHAALDAAENSEESKFAANSKLLRALRKEIWDARNRPPRNDPNRKELKKLAGRIDSALAGVEIQRQADISKAKEYELRADLSAAKTNRARSRAARQLAQQNRDRDLASKQRKAAMPEHEIARRKKQIYKAKKMQRVFNKLCKTAQISLACVAMRI
jgi:hypothetical protein